MAIVERAGRDLSAPSRAFDAVATSYDRSNRDNPLLEAMRARPLRALIATVPAGSRVLDLGCGPGTDLEALLAAGYRVTAVESPPSMWEQARARSDQLKHVGLAEVHQLAMVSSGAESSSDEVLATMNKGGKAVGRLPIELAARTRSYGVVPEYSFVLGSPPDPLGDLDRTFQFIRELKQVNPATEVVLYTYTPVPMDSSLCGAAQRLGFRFPSSLDEWASDSWRQLMMRRGDGIPWIDSGVRTRVRNFERVLNAFYPAVTDRRLTGLRRWLLRTVSAWRYTLKVYGAPYELGALHRLMQYQRPETTGF